LPSAGMTAKKIPQKPLRPGCMDIYDSTFWG
jgi:hypothetical protein